MASSDRRIKAFPRSGGPESRQGAVMILLYPHMGTLFTLFMQRPVYQGVHSGQISFPGGKREGADINLTETALRETEEETGISRNDIEILGSLTPLHIPVSNITVTPVVGYIPYRPVFTPQKSEVVCLIEAEMEFFAGATGVKETEMEIMETPVMVRYHDFNGHVIWGATAMILHELIVVMERASITWQE
ncbi:MAG: CoA pyrophosphatase [Bacteroidales bacterium]|nr:CoA pyrophosphatase [Bacteroidales bacterium]